MDYFHHFTSFKKQNTISLYYINPNYIIPFKETLPGAKEKSQQKIVGLKMKCVRRVEDRL